MEIHSKSLVVKELQGDTLTPISVYQRLKGTKKFLLESSLKHEHSGRYSFIASEPAIEIVGKGVQTIITVNTKKTMVAAHALDVLKQYVPNLQEEDYVNFPFIGGAAGFVSYDNIRNYEEIGESPKDELQVPDVHFMLFEAIVVFDHLLQKIYIVGIPLLPEKKRADIEAIVTSLEKDLLSSSDNLTPLAKVSSYQAQTTKEDFINKVTKAKEHIVEGDIFQVVLSHRMQASIEGDPFSLYRKLRVQNPSPYMYYFDFEDYVVAGVSPESLMKATQNTVYTNPIAGTRPRGKSVEEDQRHEDDLLKDEKELAEHRMLVDLGRNDLGRVCEFGSIEITKYLEIERYKHVMHLVSEVKGQLTKIHHPLDALIACLPAGTVSGAPKIRAMEIINQLEDVKRGIYSGAVGYYSANGNVDFALAIRTMVVKDSIAYIQAGAGIVYDSVPEKEYEETIHKMKAFLEVES